MRERSQDKPFLADQTERLQKIRSWRDVQKRLFDDSGAAEHFESRVADYDEAGVETNLTTINNTHQVDFIGQVIPDMITRLQASHHRKPRILDAGCGIGIFTDQLRHAFGDATKVYGTSIANVSNEAQRKAVARKVHLLEQIQQQANDVSQPLSPRTQSLRNILQSLQPNLHPQDSEWCSILQLRAFPEFDLIIDTCGELYYTEDIDDFNRIFKAALDKLQLQGKLYIATLAPKVEQALWAKVATWETENHVSIAWQGKFTKQDIMGWLQQAEIESAELQLAQKDIFFTRNLFNRVRHKLPSNTIPNEALQDRRLVVTKLP